MLSFSLPGSLLSFVLLALYASAQSSTNSTTNSTSSTSSSSSLSSSPSLSLSLTSSSSLSSSASSFSSLSSLLSVLSLSSSSSLLSSSSTTNEVGDYVAQGLGISNPDPTSSPPSSPGLYSNASQSSTRSATVNGILLASQNASVTTSSTSTSAAGNGVLIASQNGSLAGAPVSVSSSFNYSSVPAGPETLPAATSYGTAASSAYPTSANQTGLWNATTSASSTASVTQYVNGSAAVMSCYSAWVDYYSSEAEWSTSEGGFYTTETDLDTLTVTVYSTYKLCDGIPRAIVAGPTITTSTWETTYIQTDEYGDGYDTVEPFLTTIEPTPVIITVYTTVETVVNSFANQINAFSTTLTYPYPSPTCEIAPSDCASLSAQYSNAMWTGGSFNASVMAQPLCNPVSIGFSTFPCTIFVPTVQLIYWPVTLASQVICNFPNPIDITAAPNNTAIPTTVAFGQTFTSDENCYLSYPEVIAGFSVTDGTETSLSQTTLPGGILTIPSSELQSFRGENPGLKTLQNYPFNFADLPPNHVPVLAYEGMANCAQNVIDTAGNPFCQTIVENMYAPNLVYPTQFRNLDPAFATCNFNYEGIYDPPTALGTAGYLVGPTTQPGGGSQPTTPASPPSSAHAVTPPPTTVSFTQPVGPTGGSGDSGGSGSGNDQGSGGGSNGGGSGSENSGTGSNGNGNGDSSGNTGTGNTGSGSSDGSGSNAGSGDPPSGGDGNSGTGNNAGGAAAGGDPNTGETTIAVGGTTFTAPASGNSGSQDGGSNSGSNGGSGGAPALEDTDPTDGGSVTGAIVTLSNGGPTVTASANGQGGVVVAGQTLSPGGAAATIGGSVVSAGPGGNLVVANANGGSPSTIALSQISGAQLTPPPSAVLTLGGQIVTAVQGSNGGVVIDGTTLPAGQIATVDGQIVSVAPGGNAIVVAQNGQTSTISLISPNPKVAVLTLGDGQVITATSMTGPNGTPIIIVGNTALTPGGMALTTDGVVLSAGSGGLVMSGAPGSGSNVAGAIFTIGSSTFTAYESVNAQGSTIVVIGSQTLTVGGSPVTLPDGEVVSAETSGLLMVGGSGISSVPYSAIPAPTTPAADSATLTVLSPSASVGTHGPSATSTSKKGGASRMGISVWSILMASFLLFASLP